MTDFPKSPRYKIAIGKKHLLEQRRRIERNRDFISKLEPDGQPGIIVEARRLLREMEETLTRMQAEFRQGRD